MILPSVSMHECCCVYMYAFLPIYVFISGSPTIDAKIPPTWVYKRGSGHTHGLLESCRLEGELLPQGLLVPTRRGRDTTPSTVSGGAGKRE